MRDFVRDWQRWSRAERVAAVMLTSGLAVAAPALVAISHLFA
jgi:hypothetical protein